MWLVGAVPDPVLLACRLYMICHFAVLPWRRPGHSLLRRMTVGDYLLVRRSGIGTIRDNRAVPAELEAVGLPEGQPDAAGPLHM